MTFTSQPIVLRAVAGWGKKTRHVGITELAPKPDNCPPSLQPGTANHKGRRAEHEASYGRRRANVQLGL